MNSATAASRSGATELTRHVLERIERFKPALNAFRYQLKEDALVRAARAGEALSRHQSLGPLHGVPVSVKESFAVAGRPCSRGLPPFRDSTAPQNAAVVDRLLGAGGGRVRATAGLRQFAPLAMIGEPQPFVLPLHLRVCAGSSLFRFFILGWTC
jgi:Asp-tRNA(Asn)/Glu-tRNA(Gln) amidotransferase A subunit family amidase